MKKIRILVVDDHAVVRMGLISLLETESDITVVGEASNGEEAVGKARKLRPDLVLLDIVMPSKDGIAATSDIKSELPEVKILILTIPVLTIFNKSPHKKSTGNGFISFVNNFNNLI